MILKDIWIQVYLPLKIIWLTVFFTHQKINFKPQSPRFSLTQEKMCLILFHTSFQRYNIAKTNLRVECDWIVCFQWVLVMFFPPKKCVVLPYKNVLHDIFPILNLALNLASRHLPKQSHKKNIFSTCKCIDSA